MKPAGLALALATGILTACGGSSLAPANVAARVGERVIRYTEFEEYLDRSVGLESVLSSEVLSGLFDQFLDELLLRFLAVDEGVATSETHVWEIAPALIRGRSTEIGTAEISAYYLANQAEFENPERIRLRQVLASDREVVEELSRELHQGGSFEEGLRAVGEQAASGRDDELTRDDVPGAFAEVIFALEVGEVSEIVEADYGYHLFQVVERLPAERLGLEQATPEIERRLRRRESAEILIRLVSEARGRYNVEVYERNLPFNYRGIYGKKDES